MAGEEIRGEPRLNNVAEPARIECGPGADPQAPSMSLGITDERPSAESFAPIILATS